MKTLLAQLVKWTIILGVGTFGILGAFFWATRPTEDDVRRVSQMLHEDADTFAIALQTLRIKGHDVNVDTSMGRMHLELARRGITDVPHLQFADAFVNLVGSVMKPPLSGADQVTGLRLLYESARGGDIHAQTTWLSIQDENHWTSELSAMQEANDGVRLWIKRTSQAAILYCFFTFELDRPYCGAAQGLLDSYDPPEMQNLVPLPARAT